MPEEGLGESRVEGSWGSSPEREQPGQRPPGRTRLLCLRSSRECGLADAEWERGRGLGGPGKTEFCNEKVGVNGVVEGCGCTWF